MCAHILVTSVVIFYSFISVFMVIVAALMITESNNHLWGSYAVGLNMLGCVLYSVSVVALFGLMDFYMLLRKKNLLFTEMRIFCTVATVRVFERSLWTMSVTSPFTSPSSSTLVD